MPGRKRVTKFDRCLKAVKRKGGAVSPGAVCSRLKKNAGKRKHALAKRKRPIVKRNPAKRTKRNPVESATAAYRDFHGKEPGTDIIIDTPRHFHAVLAGMARLVFFDVKRAYDGGKTTIHFDKNTYLTESEKRDQMFISGGDQSVNLKDFGIYAPHEFEVLGQILKVGYFTEKKHLIKKDGGKGVYVHPFKAPRPTLIYDARSKLLMVAGGGYTIPSEGIDG